MKIVILYQFFQSELEPGHSLTLALARYLRACGDDVSVVSSEYGYMDPKPSRAPFGRLMRQEEIDGILVIRAFSSRYGHSGLVRRFFSIASFSMSCLFALLRGPRPDIIYASSPPLLPMFSAWLASRLRGASLVLEVRDLWPESLTELASPSGGALVGLMKRLEPFIYNRSTMIVTLTDGIRQNIVDRGWPASKVHTIRYGVSPTRFFPDKNAARRIRAAEGWENLTIVLYLGAHGLANDLDVILRAAGRLRARRDVRFVLIGNGIEKERLISAAKNRGLDNVVFHAPVPACSAADYINAADVCLATLRDARLFRSAIPSKLVEYMACAKAVVVGIRGEAEAIVEQAGAGLVFGPGDDSGLAACIEALADAPEKRAQMGENGRCAAVEHFSLERSQAELRSLLEEVVAGRSPH